MDHAFHPGELAVQARAGVGALAARVGKVVGTRVPAAAAEFLSAQRVAALGAADTEGRMWATLLTGEPGFLAAVDDTTLEIRTRPGPADPLAAALAGPARVGLVVLEPGVRRRWRFNGTARPSGGGLTVALDQVYGNCPKYISKREPAPAPAAKPGEATRGTRLTDAQRAAVTSADTFFVATADDAGHADASHRGGNPGFVHAPAPDRVVWPDYLGNAMFMTLGNLAVHAAAGVVFPDWSTGGLLHVSGTARIVWEHEHAAAFPGAQRLVELTVEAVVEVPGATGLAWSAPEASRYSPDLAPARPRPESRRDDG
ncbi:pyridoxamine 5'-phosphate oxidase family protein [Yinghuangia seranimata]|uniref:pyridoxamine 5'-phosphate oxidase family protein n=1 Tax=Yinghuangia seranimata TaxID=408067 RepID=UPI00248C6D41|nr:pyridoxamine 5'-phosphate oxidase family protein [Yinghuangia seranimata]MDI2127307.1 pyridoxamine 5'-phosphate oxidase family protein [Yinghuangia seranimata]